MTDEEIKEMISEAKEEGTYEEMKEEIEADIKRAKYLQTISIRKTNNKKNEKSYFEGLRINRTTESCHI